MRRATSKNPSFPRISKKCILTLNSYAKLNLYLEVLKKRPDKYHDLNTLFERITLCDRISLKPLEDSLIRVYCTDKQLQENPRKNLAYLSAMLLRKRFRIKNGVEIRIEKNIPVGSGMGGGSSNAATVLLGLNMLWGLGLTKYELAAIGAKIGSDVPFFIYDVPFALGKGRGERIQPLKRLSNMRLWHILVVPRLSVSTPKIYEEFDICTKSLKLPKPKVKINSNRGMNLLTMPQSNVKILYLGIRKRSPSLIKRGLFNSLEPITASIYPGIRHIKEIFSSIGLKSILMSGSGPAVFGICSSRKEAVRLYKRFRRLDKSSRIFLVRTI